MDLLKKIEKFNNGFIKNYKNSIMDFLKIRKIQKLHFHFRTFFSKFPFKGKILASQNSNLEFWPTWPTPLAIMCNACLLCTGAHRYVRGLVCVGVFMRFGAATGVVLMCAPMCARHYAYPNVVFLNTLPF